MYTPYLLAAIVILLLLIIAQVIRLSTLVLSLTKDKALHSTRTSKKENYEFIKGLY